MGAEIEREYLRHAWSVRVRLYAKDVTTPGQAGGVSIAMYVPVRAHRKARQGGNGLRKGSLFVANERHAVAVNRLVRCPALRETRSGRRMAGRGRVPNLRARRQM